MSDTEPPDDFWDYVEAMAPYQNTLTHWCSLCHTPMEAVGSPSGPPQGICPKCD